ncbi:hypothetical protein HWC49_gp43 [Gordonia phage Kenosha]|uniref:Uncharacterized protein n=2 Tax=Kenoshavirus TaxID=2842796 RepID=A0A649VAE2_9CAUD|nr:hypothetical protein HWC49_gp43 [Gordonia phage Kenosha]YP_009853703.1 hypothetical protein HWC79_gp44 [Gordonia phage Untouchable]QXO14648.1 membrane protein [Gordonia phage Runhaar]USH44704.1 membrane protein [Gordonia phage Burley]UVK64008.1 hypothetical protein SEA_VARDY_43 [Gordonia phage Vardy]WAB10429.1 hypothetical protein SEA_PHEPPER_44 [Gordonia phage Phepper]WIC89936.1 membrane protein [Gordonia phage Hydrus]
MLKASPATVQTALVALVAVETAILLRLCWNSRQNHVKIETLKDVARYYADMLEKNDVELSDYDIIALNTILHKGHYADTGLND